MFYRHYTGIKNINSKIDDIAEMLPADTSCDTKQAIHIFSTI